MLNVAVEILDAHGQALALFDRAVHEIGPGDWARGTPCADWSVRDLVNHLVVEQLWVPPLLDGATLDDVGDRFDGDQLGDDPVAAWETSAATAREAWLVPGVPQRTVHVSFGLIPAEEYGWQMSIDFAVHAWDLAMALDKPNPIPSDLAARLLEVVRPWVDDWQGIGLFEPPVAVGRTANEATRLVALLGRQPR
ncbi:TIGR03086 family metal-binding protein [Amycolatopsis carbonis]|uniref:TIGR03086 family metal-binding protein n=1 Tax=Amycolatopsis carbonis TaxID=715471 RepID=A0A9Y2IAG2_9PSEU|nr:TIGR03086 family metal-binding protein [Amycolatopsis sp. 2-15]WIX76097.1 TIGR03086 family metal-binding protein [Amycolatopsis sp. 2-15]